MTTISREHTQGARAEHARGASGPLHAGASLLLRARRPLVTLLLFGLGALMLTSLLAKGADMDAFARTLRAHGTIPDGLVGFTAWSVLLVEGGLVLAAAAALFNVALAPPILLAGAGLIAAFSTHLLGVGLTSGFERSCGCSGLAKSIAATAGQGLLRNGALLLGLLVGVLLVAWRPPDASEARA